MKVNRRTNANLPLQTNQAEHTTRKDASVQSSGKQGVSISPMARHLQQLLSSQEPFDAQKVEKLKELMAKGEYAVDVTALAEKLLGEMMRETGQ